MLGSLGVTDEREAVEPNTVGDAQRRQPRLLTTPSRLAPLRRENR
jgi:hypothetical protein